MKNLKLVFSCFILAFTLFSCGASFDREKFDKLIGTPIKEFFPSLTPSLPSSLYTINVSEGQTEMEKGLIIAYNNYVYDILSPIEKRKKGEEITSDEIMKLSASYATLEYFVLLLKYTGGVSRELVEKITKKAESFIIAVQKDVKAFEAQEAKKSELKTSQQKTEFKFQSVDLGESKPKTTPADEYIEQKVDLNDYLNSSTGWDDETDWNHTSCYDDDYEVEKICQEAIDAVLEANGVYWSDKKQSWVIKVKKTLE